jgi:hypothetical protein
MYKYLVSKLEEPAHDILLNKIKILALRSEYKSNKNIEDICGRILRAKKNNKYIVNNMWEANAILEFCLNNNIHATVEYSDILFRQNLDKIKVNCDSYSGKFEYIKNTRPVIYVKNR